MGLNSGGLGTGFVKGPTVGSATGGGGSGIPVPTINALGAVPYRFKFTVTHVQLQAAALQNDITLFTLMAGGVIHGPVKAKTTVAFAGTGITGYTLSVGLAGDLERYMPPFNVLSAVAATNLALVSVADSVNQGADTAVRIAATAVGANLDQSTAGSIDLWFWLSLAT